MYVFLLILLHKYPGEGKDHFQAKPCQSTCPRETLDRTCVFGKHGLGPPTPARYLLCCVCVARRVVRIAASMCLLPTSSGLQRRNIELSGVWYLSPPDGSLCCEQDVSL